VKLTTTRFTEILRAISGELFRGDAQLSIPTVLNPVVELGAGNQGLTNVAAFTLLQESFCFVSEILQVGVTAAVNIDGPALAPGAWRLVGIATINGTIAVGNALYQAALLDPNANLFPLSTWRTIGGVANAQRFAINLPITLLKSWSIRHSAPATAAGDTLAMRLALAVIRLL